MITLHSTTTKVAFALLTISFSSAQLHAGAVIKNAAGNLAMGIANLGNQGFTDGVTTTQNGAGGEVGLAIFDSKNSAGRGNVWLDVNTPGCVCQGWGVSGNGIGGGADQDVGGIDNLTADTFSSTATTAQSVVHLTTLPDLKVTQMWGASASSNIFDNKVTLSNTGTTAITDVRFVSVMDFDVPPSEFSELVTVKGTATTKALTTSHNNGFSSPNPLVASSPLDPSTVNVDFNRIGPSDQGAYFLFSFGTLAAGTSKTFDIFWGANTSEGAALADLGAVGAELYALGQSSGTPSGPAGGTPFTYDWGFQGVGGTPVVPPGPGAVPEPSTYGLLGVTLLGAAIALRRRKGARA